MENTPQKELSSLPTPEGGTEKENLNNSNLELSKDGDHKETKKNLQKEESGDPADNLSESDSDNHNTSMNDSGESTESAAPAEHEISDQEEPAVPNQEIDHIEEPALLKDKEPISSENDGSEATTEKIAVEDADLPLESYSENAVENSSIEPVSEETNETVDTANSEGPGDTGTEGQAPTEDTPVEKPVPVESSENEKKSIDASDQVVTQSESTNEDEVKPQENIGPESVSEEANETDKDIKTIDTAKSEGPADPGTEEQVPTEDKPVEKPVPVESIENEKKSIDASDEVVTQSGSIKEKEVKPPEIIEPEPVSEEANETDKDIKTVDTANNEGPADLGTEEQVPTEDTPVEKPVPVESTKEQEVKTQEKTKKEEGVAEGKESKEKEDHIGEGHDFSKFGAEEIVELVKKLARYTDMIRAEKILRKVKGRMNELRDKARAEALKQFIEDGGAETDFNFKPGELFDRFDANTRLIYDRKHHYLKELERKKEENLAKAEVLLERLREFLDGSESTSSFKVFKEIQNEWKGMGPLPGSHYRSLWANYNALVNRFYDTRSIYFELKELDRKKNLEIKIQLCEKAEALENVGELKDAIIQLNELHDEFKHTGPVPMAEQENLWQRFKGASDKVYERRKEHNAIVKKELKHNLKAKIEISDQIQSFTEFTSDRIKEWNTKTREILELQKKWEKAGGLPRDKAKEINKKFWTSFKTYFNNKNDFFRKLEGQRTENLKLKEDLIAEAKTMKDSTEWEETAQKFKQLQQKWKEIGPVPEKVRNEVYARFKSSCDYFFEQKREQSRKGSKEYEVNLEKKKTIISKIKKLSKEDKDLEKLKDLQGQFYEIGYVPRSEVSTIKTEFNDTLNMFLDGVEDIDESEKDAILLENKVEKLKHSPNADKKLHQKEQSLRKQIHKIESDISVWKNNIEFFADTKNAEKLKEEFKKKIEDASSELDHLKKELRVYASA